MKPEFSQPDVTPLQRPELADVSTLGLLHRNPPPHLYDHTQGMLRKGCPRCGQPLQLCRCGGE